MHMIGRSVHRHEVNAPMDDSHTRTMQGFPQDVEQILGVELLLERTGKRRRSWFGLCASFFSSERLSFRVASFAAAMRLQ